MKKKEELLDLKQLVAAELPRKMIGVIGGARADKTMRRAAREIGRAVASYGHVLVCGGMGGVMEAACMGAREAGGITVGILPGNLRENANPFVTIPVVTAMGHARNAIIARTADLLIAVDGRFGTLSEIALARAIGKRVLGLFTWEDIPGVEVMGSVKDVIAELEEL